MTTEISKILYDYAVRLLARGEKTVLQLTTKLTQKLIILNKPPSPEIIERIIVQLTSAGWVSEKRFAHAFARTKINQHIGPIKILYELTQQGLTKQQIDDYLSDCDAWQEVDWISQAEHVLTKKFRDEKAVFWPKKAKYLQSKGYTLEQIRLALKHNSNQDTQYES